jgi:hypothetical protein
MKKFIVNLFSNRFGIVLATLNVCYFLSRPYFRLMFAHNHGEDCFVLKSFFLFLMNISNLDRLMIIQNLPATIFSLVPYALMREIFSGICAFTQVKFQIVFFSFFIVLQWLFIAWIARTIARKFRPTTF